MRPAVVPHLTVNMRGLESQSQPVAENIFHLRHSTPAAAETANRVLCHLLEIVSGHRGYALDIILYENLREFIGLYTLPCAEQLPL